MTGHHEGALNVSSGVTCLDRATVSGAVTVSAGASLVANNATISGALTSNGVAAVELIGTTVQGAVRIAGTTGKVTLFGSTVEAHLELMDNRTTQPATIAGNRVARAFVCNGQEVPLDLDLPNTVGGAIRCTTR